MSYRFGPNLTMAENVRRIAREQFCMAVSEIADEQLPRDQAVHQVRKHCKKLRGLLRLVRPVLGETYDQENAFLRDLARSLGGTRDLDTAAESYDALIAALRGRVDPLAFVTIRERLTQLRETNTEQAPVVQQLHEVAGSLQAACLRVGDWPLNAEGFAAIGNGFVRVYNRGRRAMRLAYAAPDTEHFHDWRKFAKYHWYHLRLLHPLRPRVLNASRKQAQALGEVLGLEHDLAILSGMIADDRQSFGRADVLASFGVLIDRRREQLRRRARQIGRDLYAPKPPELLRRTNTYFNAWHSAHSVAIQAA
jgi:CHAD domain-containing protein